MWFTVAMMIIVMMMEVETDAVQEDEAVNDNLEKAELKIELCLYFQICFISDEDIRTDRKEGRQEHSPRFRKRPPPAAPTPRTTTTPRPTTPSPLKLRIQKALANCFAGDC